MKRVHPLWWCWFTAVVALPGTVAFAVSATDPYVIAYTALHGVSVFVGFGALLTFVPLLRLPVPEANSELKRLREENRRLIDALTADERIAHVRERDDCEEIIK
jgi:hypothetical protein